MHSTLHCRLCWHLFKAHLNAEHLLLLHSYFKVNPCLHWPMQPPYMLLIMHCLPGSCSCSTTCSVGCVILQWDPKQDFGFMSRPDTGNVIEDSHQLLLWGAGTNLPGNVSGRFFPIRAVRMYWLCYFIMQFKKKLIPKASKL